MPTLQVTDFLERLSRAWVPGHTVTSWLRTPGENDAVGGRPNSQHLLGLAVDVVGPQLPLLAERARAEGLTPVPEVDHLHVQRFPAYHGAIAEASGEEPPDLSGRTLLSLDKLLNELLGGEPGQTVSARLGERISGGDATLAERALCDLLDIVDPDHCERAALSHRKRKTKASYTVYDHGAACDCDTCGGWCQYCETWPCVCVDAEQYAEEPWWLRPDRSFDEELGEDEPD